MGRLLAALLADSSTVPAANPANVANLSPAPSPIFADSQVSQGLESAGAVNQATRLLAAIRAEYLPDGLSGASDAAPDQLAALPDAALKAYVSALADDAERRAGRVPQGDTAMLLCRSCGPVYVHPAIAAAMPSVAGIPRALGCPWCFIPKDGRMAIPRPSVTCGSCTHFIPDAINPQGGAGRCKLGIQPGRTPHPFTPQYCGKWRP